LRVRGFCILLVLCLIPFEDAYGGSSIRLPEVVELSNIILQGEILEVAQHQRASDTNEKAISEQRLRIRVTKVLRGKHRLGSMVHHDGTLWLGRTLYANARRARKQRRTFSSPFKAAVGNEGVFFLHGQEATGAHLNEHPIARFEWAGEPKTLRKLRTVLRDVLKTEGQRLRASSRCRLATYEYEGKCRSASDIFSMLRCPLGTSLHDSKYREFGLKLACKNLRSLQPQGPTWTWTELGQFDTQAAMVNGRRHGLTVRYGAGGKKLSGVEYVHGRRDGRVVTWHSNGTLKTDGRVINGEMDGEFRQYSADGVLLGSYTMTNGSGLMKRWRSDGDLELSAEYAQGKSHGLRTQWYRHQKKMSHGEMVHGKMHGLWTFYAPNGSIASTVCYEGTSSGSSRQLWRSHASAEQSCPPGPHTAKASD
jgi:antitoxin component YwqK of YwqJK toxin-antitoxin module